MKLYIVRHGETDWNKRRLLQGQKDTHLNKKGIKVAELTAEGYRRECLHFNAIYASPLSRAYKTAEILSQGTTNQQIQTDDRLMEIAFGDLTGCFLDEVQPEDSPLYLCYYDPERYVPIGDGETYEQVLHRVRDFIDTEIKGKSWSNDDNVLVVCHGGIIRAFLQIILEQPLKEFWNNSHKNLSTNIFIYDAKKQKLIPEALSKYYYDVDKF